MAFSEAASPTISQRMRYHLISPTKLDAHSPSLLSPPFFTARRTKAFVCGFALTFVASTLIFVSNPATRDSSPWLTNLFAASSYRSPFSSVFSRFHGSDARASLAFPSPPPHFVGDAALSPGDQGSALRSDLAGNGSQGQNESTESGSGVGNGENLAREEEENKKKKKRRSEEWLESVKKCDLFEGRWLRDESYPLYLPGSCPLIDEPFNCFLNGRPDSAYINYRWQPKRCSIPRLNGEKMLQLLRGKRLVFVGDSLNRNMWESLVCILRNSVKDKSRVFEASGLQEFRTEGSYSFIFQDYNCSVEFFQSPFLVQEWEMPTANGSKRETLQLDLVKGSFDKCKDADILVFNTGHWWTHEKTSKGKDYYQEGSHVYSELHVKEAFRKALTTWGRWIDSNVDPSKTLVVFKGYSYGHFRGGRWNSGGRCNSETEPYKDETYLFKYPRKMRIFESVMKGMKTPVVYLNITRITGLRKDAHPSIYRKPNLTEEEQRSPLRYQDCSHWCLPGVPDTWNELLYSEMLIWESEKQQESRRG